MKVAVSVSAEEAEQLKDEGIVIRTTRNGKFYADFEPKICFGEGIKFSGLMVTLPEEIAKTENVFVQFHECYRDNEKGDLVDMQTACSNNGTAIDPVYIVPDYSQRESTRNMFSILSVHYWKKFYIIKTEVLNENKVLSIIGISVLRDGREIVIKPVWLYESLLSDYMGKKFDPIVQLPGFIQTAVYDHLKRLRIVCKRTQPPTSVKRIKKMIPKGGRRSVVSISRTPGKVVISMGAASNATY